MIKKSQVLALILCLTAAPYQVYGAATASSASVAASSSLAELSETRRIFGPINAQLEALYPNTLLGFEAVKDGIVPVVRRVEGNFLASSTADVLAMREYYFRNFFQFMDGLKAINPAPTPEFKELWNSITKEAGDAVNGGLGEIKWHMIQTMFMRGLLLASGGGSTEA